MKSFSIRYILLFVSIGFVALIIWHNVPRSIRKTDIPYINKYLEDARLNEIGGKPGFNSEIEIIRRIQEAVLRLSPVGVGIPENKERRPRDLYEAGEGLCFDRSFVLELIYRHIGLEARHVSIFKDSSALGTLKELSTAGIPSHAVSEVKTSRGWMIVDSNNPWIGLDHDSIPYSMKTISISNYAVRWVSEPPGFYYREKCHFFYGLYSRHGRFFKPYTPLPDYNLRELLFNFF